MNARLLTKTIRTLQPCGCGTNACASDMGVRFPRIDTSID